MDKIYRSCGNCKHWEATVEHVGKEVNGICILNPPTPLLNMDGDIIYIFPETLAAHKCGQWLPLETQEKIESFEIIRPYGQKADEQG